MGDRPHTFNCPYCDHETELDWPAIIAALFVMRHFNRAHPRKMFRVGCPLFDDEPPAPGEFEQ